MTRARRDLIAAAVRYIEDKIAIEVEAAEEVGVDEVETPPYREALEVVKTLLPENPLYHTIKMWHPSEVIVKCGLAGLVWFVEHSDCSGCYSPGQVYDMMRMVRLLTPFVSEEGQWMYSRTGDYKSFFIWKVWKDAVDTETGVYYT